MNLSGQQKTIYSVMSHSQSVPKPWNNATYMEGAVLIRLR